MPEMNGLEATRQIKKELPETGFLSNTMYETDELIRKVVASGARGYVLKSDAGEDLIQGVEALHAAQVVSDFDRIRIDPREFSCVPISRFQAIPFLLIENAKSCNCLRRQRGTRKSPRR
jgi:hypothetical protein